nr:hypothetical protein [Tanacetum cinerariifolium]
FVSRFNDNNNKKRNTGSWSNGNNGTSGNKGNYDSLLCKNCGLKGHTVDMCFELIGYPPGFKRNPNLKPANNNNNRNSNADTRGGFVINADGKTPISHVSLSNKQMLRLISLLNDKSSTTANANMVGANQYMTNSVKNMFNLVDVSGLKLTVGHLNGTLAKITHVGNLKLNNNVILFDVLVVPEYTDLKKGKVLGTGSDCWLPSSVLNVKYPFSIVYNREPKLSHLRSFGCLCYATIVKETDKFSNKSEKYVLIGYASDKKAYKLLSLENRNVFYSRDVKFYETIFPYKMNKSYNFEKDFVFGVTDFFYNFESQIASTVLSPNDDEEGSTSGRDSRLHQPGPLRYDELQSATLVDETNSSEGNVGINLEVPVFQNILENQNEEVNLRRSSRTSKSPTKLNVYVLNNTASLNKSCEPSFFKEASKDVNWINALNNEMHALYENKNWELVNLSYGRKPIGSRWVYKIKYMSSGEIESSYPPEPIPILSHNLFNPIPPRIQQGKKDPG